MSFTRGKMNSDITKDSESFAATDVAEHLRGVEIVWQPLGLRATASIEQILADDWSVIDLTGRILSKAEVLEEVFGSKDRKIVSMQIDDLSVRSFGDWAIVTGGLKRLVNIRVQLQKLLFVSQMCSRAGTAIGKQSPRKRR